MKSEIKEALHVIGQLLETNGTKGALAVDKNNQIVANDHPSACKWCLVGARNLVCSKLLGSDRQSELRSVLGHYLGTDNLILLWDHSSNNQRKQIVEKLKNA
jgi:hypothetical protein